VPSTSHIENVFRSLSREIDSLRADAVFGWRQLNKKKVTSAAAILSLALAIGACTSAFRLIDALFLRPLPVTQPERLYALSRQGFPGWDGPFSYDGWEYPLFRQMRAAVRSQASLIAISYSQRVDLTYGSDYEKAHVQYVSGWMFGSFGLRPAVGRLLTENDDLNPGQHPVAVFSHDYWTRRFGQDPKVIGRTFRLGNNLYEIAGVAGEGFNGVEPGTVIDIFMPTMMHWGITQPKWALFRTFVSLRQGVAVEPVRDRLRATFRGLHEQKDNQTLLMEPAAAGLSGMQKNYRLSLIALGVLVGLVLLIACANVANLMAAQAAARAREMALRVSIGAGRRHLVQLVLVESAILAFLAAALGGLFAWWSAPFVVSRINPPDDPARLSLSADWRVLAFGLALTLGVTILFGMAPALRASRISPVSALKGGEDPHSRRRLMHVLIAVQVAFCFLVLFVAGLFVATLDRLSHQPTGFSADRLLNLDIATQRHEPTSLWNQVADRLRNVPGVETVAFADWPLLDGYSFKYTDVSINGAPPGDVSAWFMNVSPGWIDAVKIPFIDGRDFRANDLSPGVAIVNEAFARQYFDGKNPIGKWFEGTSGYMRGQRFQIVGLVRDARYRYLRQPVVPVAYTPFHRMDDKGTMLGGTFVVRTSSPNPLALAAILRREVSRARPEFRVSNIRTQKDLEQLQTVRERLLAMLALFFAVVALLLAGVGLYGVLDYSVFQRRREIGIRMAIGAQAGDIARRVTVEVFSMVVAGALAGLALGMASARYIATLLYQVKPTDVGVLALPSLTILAAALLAALPAVIHAVRIDPVTMLRSE
jgi:predicted permease